MKQTTKTETIHVRLSSTVKNESEEITKAEELAFAINLTGGKDVSPNLKKIIHLYAKGDIDYETACFAIERNFE